MIDIENIKETARIAVVTEFKKFQKFNLIIWGTGVYGLDILNILEEFGLAQNVKGFCNSFFKDGQLDSINGYAVRSVSNSIQKFPDALYIIASDFYAEILKFIDDNELSIKTFVCENSQISCELKRHIFFSTKQCV